MQKVQAINHLLLVSLSHWHILRPHLQPLAGLLLDWSFCESTNLSWGKCETFTRHHSLVSSTPASFVRSRLHHPDGTAAGGCLVATRRVAYPLGPQQLLPHIERSMTQQVMPSERQGRIFQLCQVKMSAVTGPFCHRGTRQSSTAATKNALQQFIRSLLRAGKTKAYCLMPGMPHLKNLLLAAIRRSGPLLLRPGSENFPPCDQNPRL